MKVFWCSNFSKMLPRCGRVAHICGANSILQSVFPAAIAFFETVKSAILWFVRNKLQIRTRQRGNCSMLAGKSRGGTPFCRTLKIGIPKNVFRWDVSLQLFPRNSCKILVSRSSFTRRGGLVRRLEKLSLFSPPAPCARRMARGFRCLRAAIRATRPEPRQHFWKIVGSKNFYLPAARFLQPIS